MRARGVRLAMSLILMQMYKIIFNCQGYYKKLYRDV